MTELAAPLPLSTRLWLAWMCFFKVLFDAAFAGRVWSVRQGVTPTLPAKAEAATPASKPPTDDRSALQLLSLLQREGRLVDFLQQDIAAFPDADVGAAARVVHEGCRRALKSHAEITPVRLEDEGARVQLAAGYDADAVKLVGDVRGDPPYAGVLRHRGWRAIKLQLPSVVGDFDARILAPAEVELG